MRGVRCTVWVLAICGTLAASHLAAAQPAPRLESLDSAVCRLIEHAAHANDIPAAFLTRVIWRESSFRPGAVSAAGALGIAQFMPGTAQERGLLDPFDPEQAIPKAARLLADLRRRFGNLGIAAAAYNAGAARVATWLRGDAQLPAQTRAYVRFITDRSADAWRESGSSGPPRAKAQAKAEPMPEAGESCLKLTVALRRDHGGGIGGAGSAASDFVPLAPWGVQLAGNFSKSIALASFMRAEGRYAGVIGNVRPMIIGRLLRSMGTRTFYEVRLPAPSRAVAVALCGRIQAVGGACVPMRS